MPDFAEGIPDKSEYGDIQDLNVGDIVSHFVQRHNALKAGKHDDLRIGNKKGKLYSWAIPKYVPEPGEDKKLAVQTQLHRESYGPFQGYLKGPYGKGYVESKVRGKALITSMDNDGLTFVTATERYPQRFRLQKLKGKKDWLLLNVTPTEPRQYQKIHYKVVPSEDVEKLFTPKNLITAKIDGSAAFIELLGDKIELLSYRPQKATGRPIVHTERAKLYEAYKPVKISNESLKQFKQDGYVVIQNKDIDTDEIVKTPVGLMKAVDVKDGSVKLVKTSLPRNTVLRGEIFGEDKEGNPVSAASTGGLLNSTISNSFAEQNRKKLRLRTALFDIKTYKGKSLEDMPYRDRYKLLKEIAEKLPKDKFYVVQGETEKERQKQLWKDIITGENTESVEGIVSHPLEGGIPSKVKLRPEFDVIIKKIFPGEGKYKDKAAGGFYYALPENPDKIVGKVGGGLSDKERYEMLKNPEEWIGRTARITAQEQFPSGAYRAPSYIARHEDIQQKSASSKIIDEHTVSFDGKTYDVYKLWSLTEKLKSKPAELDKLKWILSKKIWGRRSSGHRYTPNDVLKKRVSAENEEKEKERINNANLSYPILTYQHKNRKRVLDGVHRLVRAITENSEIKEIEVPDEILAQAEKTASIDYKTIYKIYSAL